MDHWRATAHYRDGTTAELEFEDFDDFRHWMTVGPDHDWTVLAAIVIVRVTMSAPFSGR